MPKQDKNVSIVARRNLDFRYYRLWLGARVIINIKIQVCVQVSCISLLHLVIRNRKMLIVKTDTYLLDMHVTVFSPKIVNGESIPQKLVINVSVNFVTKKSIPIINHKSDRTLDALLSCLNFEQRSVQ
jgi:hypothetical protein